jgi:hypothetical protein
MQPNEILLSLTSTHFTIDKVKAAVPPRKGTPAFSISLAVVAARVVYWMRFFNFVEDCGIVLMGVETRVGRYISPLTSYIVIYIYIAVLPSRTSRILT